MSERAKCFDQLIEETSYPIQYFNFVTPQEAKIVQTEEALYYQTGYAAKLIHKVLRNSGFKQTDEVEDANIVVGGNLSSEGKILEYYHQKTNHYEKTFSLGSKAGYHHVMENFAARVGKLPSFYPETYLLPDEYSEMLDAFPKSKLWIQKPAGGSRGNGIKVIDTPPSKGIKRIVVQNYLDNPLLINGLKFDLRFYVAVTSLVPLRIYLFDNGLVRLATEPYDSNHDDITNRSAHLTNFSINKENENFHVTNDLADDGKGNKWSHRPFWPWLAANGFNPEEIRSRIEDAFATTIIACRETFRRQHNIRESFELFGFDVMLAKDGDVHILEVNVSPALGTSSNLDMAIKAPLVKDLFNIALLPHPSEELDLIEGALSGPGKNQDIANAMAVIEYELAQRRLGGFHCIYPTKERVATVGKMLEIHEPEDVTLEQWVTAPEDQREMLLKGHLTKLYGELSKLSKEDEK